MKTPYVAGKWMTVDPGLMGTGYAIWSEEWELLESGILKSKGIELADRCEDLAGQLRVKVRSTDIQKVFFEFPAFFGSAGGQVTAASGALVKLVFLVGWMSSTVNVECGVEFVKVNSWKGQMPKDLVWERILKKLPGCKAVSHALDAVGIGLYVSGRF